MTSNHIKKIIKKCIDIIKIYNGLIQSKKRINKLQKNQFWIESDKIEDNLFKKKLIIRCDEGLSNRILVLTTGMLISNYTKRQLIVVWEKNKFCGAKFNELFSNKVNIIEKTQKKFIIYGNYHGKRNEYFDIIKRKDDNLYILSNHELLLPVKYKNHRKLIKKIPLIFRELNPSLELKIKIKDFINKNFQSPTIGIHVRKSDFIRFNKDYMNNEGFYNEIDKIIKIFKYINIYLATDDGAPDPITGEMKYLGVERAFRERYPDRIITYPVRSNDRNTIEALQDALIEMYLLQFTIGIIGTKHSTFTKISSILKDRREFQKTIGPYQNPFVK